MRVITTYLNTALLIFFLFGINTKALAQPALGVVWDQPETLKEAQSELDLFAGSGVEYIELSHPVNNDILSLLDSTSFTVFVRLQPEFLTVSDLAENKDEYLSQLTSDVNRYRNYTNIRGIGLLSNSQISHPDFDEIFLPFMESLASVPNTSFYAFNADKWYYLDNTDQHFAIYLPHLSFAETDLYRFNELMNSKNSLVFVNSNWLIQAVKNYTELSQSIVEYKQNKNWQLALPDTKPEPSSFPNWLVLLLLLSWLGLSVQIRFLPYIRPMLIRYFLAHRFFVDDILHYRERAALGGILLMIQHAIFSGMMLFMSAKVLFSTVGVEAFFHHLPALAITGSNHVSFFFLGVLAVLITQVIALFWLYLPAKHIEHFSQTINLYSGLFFIDFILATITLTLYITGFGVTTLLSMALVFVVIWYAAFNIAAVDMSKNMAQGKLTYLLFTIGLHAIISIGLLTYLLTSTDLIQVLQLAASL